MLIGFLFVFSNQSAFNHKKKKKVPDNHECLNCHGHPIYTLFSKDSTQKKKMLMCQEQKIDSTQYAHSTHGLFKCTDCHDEGYKIYPHDCDLKFSQMMNCMDCHGDNKKFAKYHFEIIEQEAIKSVHFKKISTFTCWNCHNPHTYVNIFYKAKEDKSLAIEACNNACMSCHDNKDKFRLYSKNKMKDISESHEWLPERERHFKSLRCTDCHAVFWDSIASFHNITTASMAVKNCVECHSMNSRLSTTLYKFEAKAERKKYGFVNSAILNNSFVIGANRNYYLNVISFIIFSALILVLLIHYIIWHYTRKKNKNV